MTTLPPFAASMRAVPSPRPEAPPVTMKTLPAMSMRCSVSCVSERGERARGDLVDAAGAADLAVASAPSASPLAAHFA